MPFLKRMLNVSGPDLLIDAAGLVSGTGVLCCRLCQKLKTWLRRQCPSSSIHRRSDTSLSEGISSRRYSSSD